MIIQKDEFDYLADRLLKTNSSSNQTSIKIMEALIRCIKFIEFCRDNPDFKSSNNGAYECLRGIFGEEYENNRTGDIFYSRIR